MIRLRVGDIITPNTKEAPIGLWASGVCSHGKDLIAAFYPHTYGVVLKEKYDIDNPYYNGVLVTINGHIGYADIDYIKLVISCENNDERTATSNSRSSIGSPTITKGTQ
jgi:hypothetical protein